MTEWVSIGKSIHQDLQGDEVDMKKQSVSAGGLMYESLQADVLQVSRISSLISTCRTPMHRRRFQIVETDMITAVWLLDVRVRFGVT